MKDVRPWVFAIGVLSTVGALVTRFYWRDQPAMPKPGAFLDFASVCFLMVIAIVLVEILGVLRQQCAAPKEAPKAEPEKPAEES